MSFQHGGKKRNSQPSFAPFQQPTRPVGSTSTMFSEQPPWRHPASLWPAPQRPVFPIGSVDEIPPWPTMLHPMAAWLANSRLIV
jgi:hypothetical protein